MATFRLSHAAESDIIEALAWSETRFGSAARARYEHLVVAAILDVATKPDRPGSLSRAELGADIRSWHLRGSRDRVLDVDGVVMRPRHLLVYRPVSPDLLLIGRMLHDSMELERHGRGPEIWR